ncbi:MAG: hypothetical protein GY739_21675, partial [Mesoflavibacter sp.]|nr:hypothetical protein [Mesoflavibacter sp.]
KVNEINEKLITVLEEKILLLEDQKAINEEIIEIQKEQLFLSGVSNNEERVAYCHAEKDYTQTVCDGYCPDCEYYYSD